MKTGVRKAKDKTIVKLSQMMADRFTMEVKEQARAYGIDPQELLDQTTEEMFGFWLAGGEQLQQRCERLQQSRDEWRKLSEKKIKELHELRQRYGGRFEEVTLRSGKKIRVFPADKNGNPIK